MVETVRLKGLFCGTARMFGLLATPKTHHLASFFALKIGPASENYVRTDK
jgi:hypothetical protein